MTEALDMLRAQLVANLTRLMAERGENPTSLALKAGLNHRAVHDILQGRSKYPRADTLRALSLALAAAPETLLNSATTTSQNHGTGTLGNTGNSAGFIAAAYQQNTPITLDSVQAYPAPEVLAGTRNPQGADLFVVPAPKGGFPGIIPIGSFIVLDVSATAKQAYRPGVYWVSRNGVGVLMRLVPDLGAENGMVAASFFEDGANPTTQTIAAESLDIQGRVHAVINEI